MVRSIFVMDFRAPDRPERAFRTTHFTDVDNNTCARTFIVIFRPSLRRISDLPQTPISDKAIENFILLIV